MVEERGGGLCPYFVFRRILLEGFLRGGELSVEKGTGDHAYVLLTGDARVEQNIPLTDSVLDYSLTVLADIVYHT